MKKIISSLAWDARVIYLDGPRWCGKSHLLQTCKEHLDTQGTKRFYYSFDENVVSKYFQNLDEFLHFLWLKTWCDPQRETILLLNEVHYCTNSKELLQEYADKKFPMRIIATGAKPLHFEWHKHIDTHTIHPFDFWEYLQYHGYNPHNVPLDRGYKSIYAELQTHFVDFLKRWGYPGVVVEHDEELKRRHLREIVQDVLAKDGWVIFNREELFSLERFFEALPANNLLLRNHSRIALHTNQSVYFVKKCFSFVAEYFLVHLIPVKWDTDANKKAELLTFGDLWMLHLMNQSFGIPLLDHQTLLSFVWSEVTKLAHCSWHTYQKHNGSAIDLIGTFQDTRIAIIVDNKNTEKLPKILQQPSTQDKRDIAITTTYNHFWHELYNGKEVYRMPAYLVSRWLYEKRLRGDFW